MCGHGTLLRDDGSLTTIGEVVAVAGQVADDLCVRVVVHPDV